MQVFQLTNEQIGALPPDQRVGVMQLVSLASGLGGGGSGSFFGLRG
jgi:hypothetical protein